MQAIKKNIPLSSLTTFEIGGVAKYFVEVKNEEDIQEVLAWAREKNVRFFVMGGGSNLLVSDEGYDGLVIRMMSDHFNFTDATLTAEAGCNLLTLIHGAAEEGLGGWEKLAGIPGTIGGAVRGNAGAFGSEIKDFVTWVRALNTKTGEVHEFSNAECQFSYRMSFFKKNPHWIILNVRLALSEVKPHVAREEAEKTIAEREKRHIQNVRAAGSYFMNPIAPHNIVAMFESEKGVESRGGRVPAGWLIEKAGMKGARVGGAVSSLMHPNYLVNESGSATASEVHELAGNIKAAVQSQFGVILQEEAVVL